MDNSWEVKVKGFLRRTGEEIKNETQKLIDEMSNPANQEKVRQSPFHEEPSPHISAVTVFWAPKP